MTITNVYLCETCGGELDNVYYFDFTIKKNVCQECYIYLRDKNRHRANLCIKREQKKLSFVKELD